VIRLETGEVLFTQYGSSPEDKLREMINALGNEISDSIAALRLRWLSWGLERPKL